MYVTCIVEFEVSHSYNAAMKLYMKVILITIDLMQVVDVDSRTEGGFTESLITIEGLEEFAGHSLKITAKNENLLAHQLMPDGTLGQLLACTPDLITVMDTDTGSSHSPFSYISTNIIIGYPITSGDIHYGQRVSAVAIPAHPALKTPQALPVVGPSGFGYNDITYNPLVNVI